MEEVEVFRIQPVANKCYEHAEYTRREGRYHQQERYFTNVPPRYVGEYIRSESGGSGDGSWHRDFFKDVNGDEIRIDYSYEGRTSFREVPCRRRTLPRELIHSIATKRRMPKLKDLALYQMRTSQIADLRERGIMGGGSNSRVRSSTRKSKPKKKIGKGQCKM